MLLFREGTQEGGRGVWGQRFRFFYMDEVAYVSNSLNNT